MAIPRSLILLWLGITALLGLMAFSQWRSERRLFLPVPPHPQQVRYQNGEDSVLWQRQDGQWHINDQLADSDLINTWFSQLRTCRGNYRPQDIAPTIDPAPLSLEIDGERYQFGAANPFSQSHYVRHGDRIYLCNEAVKSTLHFPVQMWLEQPDA